MDKKEKGATLSNTPTDNTEAKVQNIPDTRKDINVILDFFLLLSDKTLARAHTCIRPQKKGKKLCPFPRIL